MKKNIYYLVVALIIFGIIAYYQSQSNPTLTPSPIRAADNSTPPPPTPTLTPTPTPIPTPYNNHPTPKLSAKSYIIYDLNSDTPITQYNSHQSLPPASTTKIMTAVITLENYPLSEIITVPHLNVAGSKINLVEGEKITVKNLLYGLLLQSGNDAATVLAMHYPTGETGFIKAMNEKAIELHMQETNYQNPHGLHDPLHLSSTNDLVKVAKYAIKNPTFAQIVNTKTKTIYSIDQKYVHHLNNLNQLLGTVPGVKGIKTGWTEEAGEALVTLIDRNNHPVILAVLASQDRFNDTKLLIDWTYDYTIWPN